MKGTLLLLMLLSYHFCGADCSNSGVSVWPDNGTISNTPIIMLEAYYESSQIISEVPAKYPMFLVAAGHKVSLVCVTTNIGANGQCQMLLKPTQMLMAGKTYELKIENLPNADDYFYYHEMGKIAEWTVEKPSTSFAPQFLTAPTESGKTLRYFGCGIENHVDFSLNVKAGTPFLVKVLLHEVQSGAVLTYFIEPRNNLVEVGRHMCGGAFNLGEGTQYEIEFSLLDASGNYSKTSSGKIAFTAPINIHNH